MSVSNDIDAPPSQDTLVKCPSTCPSIGQTATKPPSVPTVESQLHIQLHLRLEPQLTAVCGTAAVADEDNGDDDDASACRPCQFMQLVHLPGRKERRKDLSFVMSRMNIHLHDLDWRGFHGYTEDLLQRNPDNLDYAACMAVHKPYLLRVTTGALYALKYLESNEAQVINAPSSDFLMIRFLTMKAFLLYFLGRQKEAQILHEQAVLRAHFLEACNPTAHNLYYYALNSLLHNRGMWGPDQMPLESTWVRAESCYKQSAEEHCIWVEDLDGDPKVKEGDSMFHFLITIAKYMMCRLRTCASAEGFNILIRGQRITPRLLDDIDRNLREIEAREENISPRGFLYYCLARCDYNLRCYQERGDKNKHLDEAETWAKRAGHKTAKLKEKKLKTFVRTFIDCRLAYIDEKRTTTHPEDRSSRSASGKHLTPLTISNCMSHMDFCKEGASEEKPPHHLVSDDCSVAVKFVDCSVRRSPSTHSRSDPTSERHRQTMSAETFTKS